MELKNLLLAVDAQKRPPIDWIVVAQYMDSRSRMLCRHKWHWMMKRDVKSISIDDQSLLERNRNIYNAGLMQPTDENSLISNTQRRVGQWTASECDRLRQAFAEVKTMQLKEAGRKSLWAQVAAQMPGRNVSQCRHRWDLIKDDKDVK